MSTKRSFHHGDLRAALIEAARSAIERDGVENLSLRSLAQEIGVARSAPYRHFETKQELLDTLAAVSRQETYDAYLAIPADLPPIERLKRACAIYLAYVRAHPNMVSITFAGHTSPVERTPGTSPLMLFTEMVRDAMPGADAPMVNLTAMACWSALHGFSMLALSGRTALLELPDDAETELLDTILKMVR